MSRIKFLSNAGVRTGEIPKGNSERVLTTGFILAKGTEGEISYRDPDFTPATEIYGQQSNLYDLV